MKKKNMMIKRYGHSVLYNNGMIYCLGGFSHKDLPNEIPVTLASCERYSVAENQWAYISTMNEARAFFGSVILEQQFIYCFGGLHDFNVLHNIEKYDLLQDHWVVVHLKLPLPLSKLGCVALDSKTIIVCGGMSDDFEP